MTTQEKTIENKLQELEVSKNPELFSYLELYKKIILYDGNLKIKYLDRAYAIKKKIRENIR